MVLFFKHLLVGQMKHHFLMVCVVLWVFSQINVAFSAEQSVLKDAGFGIGADVRSINREPEGETLLPVSERNFPAFSPKGLIVGKLLVFPKLAVGGFYNDNLFASSTNEESDSAAVIAPAISIRTIKDRHFFGMSLSSEIVRYADNHHEDVENFEGSAGGYFEIKHDMQLPWKVSYSKYHQDRANNLSRVFTRDPLEISTAEVEGGVSYKPNRLGLKVLGRHTRKYFEDGVSLADPAFAVVRSDANFSTTELEVETGYEFPANHVAFLRSVFGETRYDKGIYDDGAAVFTNRFRDSRNISVLAGVITKYKGLLSSDIGIGYSSINFKDDTISDVENIAIDANLDWNITKLSTLGLDLTRSIIQDNEIVQGIVQTQGTLSLDHELRRQIVLSAYATYINRDFDGTTREDDLYRMGLGVLYRPSPYYNVKGEYIHSTQNSTFTGNDFERNLFMIRLTGQY